MRPLAFGEQPQHVGDGDEDARRTSCRFLDIVGAPCLPRNLALLAIEGRLCCLAGDGGRTVQLDLLPVLQKRISITGGSLRRRPVHEKARLAATIEHRVWPWVPSGALRPQVGLVLPLQQAAQAHLALQERRVTGKAVLVTDAGGARQLSA